MILTATDLLADVPQHRLREGAGHISVLNAVPDAMDWLLLQ